MRSIRGNLSFMSVMDIIQWADQNKRSGTLTLFLDERQKKFYFQEGATHICLVRMRGGADCRFFAIRDADQSAEIE